MTLSRNTELALATMPERLSATFSLVPPEYWSWTPASWEGIPGERFSPIGQLCHVRDIEREGYHVRVTRMLEEENPVLLSLDSYALADGRNYETEDPREVLRVFAAAREKTLHLLRDLKEEQLARRGTFGEYGPLTLRSLVHYLASHDNQHVACLDWLIGQIYAKRG